MRYWRRFQYSAIALKCSVWSRSQARGHEAPGACSVSLFFNVFGVDGFVLLFFLVLLFESSDSFFGVVLEANFASFESKD
jgi:hypothetical protein